MHGDVYVDAAVLARVRAHLQDVHELLSRPARAVRDVDGSALGARDLARRLDDFAHEWAYGIERLASFSRDAVQALDAVERAFDEADHALAAALQDER